MPQPKPRQHAAAYIRNEDRRGLPANSMGTKKARIIDLHNRHWSPGDIAHAVDTTPKEVRKVLRKEGLLPVIAKLQPSKIEVAVMMARPGRCKLCRRIAKLNNQICLECIDDRNEYIRRAVTAARRM